jgi:hypothetical protein
MSSLYIFVSIICDTLILKMKRPLITSYIKSFLILVISLTVITGVVLQNETVKTWISQATGRPANLIVDANALAVSRTKPWQNFAQGGESIDYSFSPVSAKVRALSPQYIRLDHIYDFYNVVNRSPNGSLTFDFSGLDARLEEITAMGAKPFISLSYMPPAITSGDIVDPPVNWADWSLVVQRTIEHISGSNGKNISDVYYEVWNEPDLFGGWKLQGDKNYLDMYYHAAKGAAGATNVNEFRFGGPATTSLYKNWVTKLIEFTNKNNLRLDFYSWHAYSANLDTYHDQIKDYQSFVAQASPSSFLEPIITEWGITPEVHPWNDQQIAAIHTLAASAIHAPFISKAFIFEVQDGLDPAGQEYWGRWGLLTHQQFGSREKPRYKAIQTLNQLDGSIIPTAGMGSWVKAITTRSLNNRTLKTLIVNYDVVNHNTETVPITYLNLDEGTYTLTETYGIRTPTSREVSLTGPTLVHQVFLPPNSYVLLELSLQ